MGLFSCIYKFAMLHGIVDFVDHVNTSHWVKISGVLSVVLLAVGYAVGFSIATQNAREKSDADYDRRLGIYNEWQMEVTSRFTRAESTAATLASFVASHAHVAMNFSATPADRMITIYPDMFNQWGKALYDATPGLFCLVLAPGGVVSQVYPPGQIASGFDAINHAVYSPAFDQFLESGQPVVTGPTNLITMKAVAINAWYPVFINVSTTRPSKSTLWGAACVMMKVIDFMNAMQVNDLYTEHQLDYVLWYEDSINSVNEIVMTNNVKSQAEVMNNGMRIELPIGEVGKTTYLGMYPEGGATSEDISTEILLIIIFVVILITLFILFAYFASIYLYFMYRHRRAPKHESSMYMAAFTLRGAQPIADHAPLEAVRMFNNFNQTVRAKAREHGCYPVCEIGDRTVYIVSKRAENLMALAAEMVVKVTIFGRLQMDNNDNNNNRIEMQPTGKKNGGTSRKASSAISSRSVSQSNARSASRAGAHVLTEEIGTESSFIGNVSCHPSVALHCITAHAVYDPARDCYFYGNSNQLSKLCAALDTTKCGEVAWTEDMHVECPNLCRATAQDALTYNTVSEGADAKLHVAAWWKETGDERDNEDPSTALAAISDAYVKRMTVIVSQGRMAMKGDKKKGKNGSQKSGGDSSNKSNEAAVLTRSCTLLHVEVGGDMRAALDVVRRIVTDEKGVVVSAHECTIVAAFNLMSAGGHHQIRAADTAMRLRQSLGRTGTPFVCSIHHGKVNAFVIDGLVMCTGDTVTVGRHLLSHASGLAATLATSNLFAKPTSTPTTTTTVVEKFTSDSDSGRNMFAKGPSRRPSGPPKGGRKSTGGKRSRGRSPDASSVASSAVVPAHNNNDEVSMGLCLLFCHSELSSVYDCEAVDVLGEVAGGKLKVVYRLADRKSGKASEEEWMYKLKDEEDTSPFAAVNAIFTNIAAGEKEEAARVYHKLHDSGVHISQIAQLTISKRVI